MPIKLEDVPERFTGDERETYVSAYNTFYDKCKGDGGTKCDELATTAAENAVKTAKTGGRKKKKDHKAGLNGSGMVAFYLPTEVASQLALPVAGALAAEDLHLTLCYLADDMIGLADEKMHDIKRAVALWAKHQVPIEVRINGVARFTQTDDLGTQPIVALIEGKHLRSLQGSLDSYIRYDGGYDFKYTHDFTPHITLGYFPGDAGWPVLNLADITFTMSTVVLKIGDMSYSVELTGELQDDMMAGTASFLEVAQKAGARNSARDRTAIQDIHDTTTSLGAKCATLEDLKGWPLLAGELALVSVREAWVAKQDEENSYLIKAVYDDILLLHHQEDGKSYLVKFTHNEDEGYTFEQPETFEFKRTNTTGESEPVSVEVKTMWTCAIEGHYHETPEDAQTCISTTTLNTPVVRSEFVKSAYSNNCLKTIAKTDDELIVANYMVLFQGRDLEGIASNRVNPDGTTGEYFTKGTLFESDYTQTGRLLIDWEHRTQPDGVGPDQEDILGYVDWKSAVLDSRGLFVKRVLNRRNRYIEMLEELFDAGMIGSSTEPVQKGVMKGYDGEIKAWPLKRDSFSVSPMDFRMMTTNHLEIVKALKDNPDGCVVYKAVMEQELDQEVAIAEAEAVLMKARIEAGRH